jgi:integrase
VFPGKGSNQNCDVPIDSRSIYNAVQQAAKRAGLDKRVHPHTIRHYAGFRTIPGEVDFEPIGGSLTDIFPA